MNSSARHRNWIAAFTGLASLWLLFPSAVFAQKSNWANWRGSEQNGISRETNLVDNWSLEPKVNVDWVADTGGRCTPIVLNGRIYLNCRTKDDFNDCLLYTSDAADE